VKSGRIAGLAGASVLLVSLSCISSVGAQATENEPETIEMVNEAGLVERVEVDHSPSVKKSEKGTAEKSKKGTYDLSELEGELIPPSLPLNLANAEMDTPPYAQPLPPEHLIPDEDFGTMSVIGTDTRVKVSNVQASPYIQTPFIGYERGGQWFLCTGYLIGRYAIATAAHCLYQGGQYSTQMSVYFGLEGTSAVAGCGIDHYSVPSQWTSSQSHEYDWGVVQLNCNAGEVFGHYGFMNPGTGPFGTGFKVTGYPGDKAANGGYTMWQDTGSIDIGDDRKLWYRIDTAGGQSGAPIWYPSGTACGNCAIGVHAYGVSPSFAYPTYNSGSRITNEVASVFTTYRNGWVTRA
jgi:glutamyl endopeptidase